MCETYLIGRIMFQGQVQDNGNFIVQHFKSAPFLPGHLVKDNNYNFIHAKETASDRKF